MDLEDTDKNVAYNEYALITRFANKRHIAGAYWMYVLPV